MLRFARTLLATVIFAICSGSAWALSVTVSATGTVAPQSFDNSNVFGLGAGQDLGGQAFTLVYQFETFLAGSYNYQDSTQSFTAGGTIYLPFDVFDSPLLNASLTINGKQVGFGGNYYAVTSAYNDGSISGVNYNAMASATNYLTVIINTVGTLLPSSIDAPFVYSLLPGDGQSNSFRIGDDVAGQLLIGQLSAAPSAVPLPPSLVAQLTGLGLLGLIAWRRKRKDKLV